MRRRRTIVSSVLVALATPCVAASLTPWHFEELGRQWRRGVPQSPAVAVPSPITRDERVEPVSLKDAIALALANHPRVAAQRLEPTRQEAGVLQAQAQYDATFSGDLLHSHSITPNASSLAGRRTLVVDDRSANFHLFKAFRGSGTLATI